ncbi:MAG: hypothetical protein ACPGFC_10270, partial [Paracoccaceae bacterium]
MVAYGGLHRPTGHLGHICGSQLRARRSNRAARGLPIISQQAARLMSDHARGIIWTTSPDAWALGGCPVLVGLALAGVALADRIP